MVSVCFPCAASVTELCQIPFREHRHITPRAYVALGTSFGCVTWTSFQNEYCLQNSLVAALSSPRTHALGVLLGTLIRTSAGITHSLTKCWL